MQVTPWFGGGTFPARPGLYQRMAPAREEINYACFNPHTGQWFLGDPNPEIARRNVAVSMWQDLPWRGIVK